MTQTVLLFIDAVGEVAYVACIIALTLLVQLDYNKDDLQCEYHRRAGHWARLPMLDVATWVLICATFIPLCCDTAILLQVVRSPWKMLDFIWSVAMIVVSLSTGCVNNSRQQEKHRLLSLRYMRHKYSAQDTALVTLLAISRLPHFPVAYFEREVLALDEKQRQAHSASKQVKARTVQELQRMVREARLPSGANLASCEGRGFYAALEKEKLEKLSDDYYATGRREEVATTRRARKQS
jgi:hypothetical protein